MNIITEKITFGGNSLGKIDGKNVFVPYAIPGETYKIEITEHKKDYDIACIKNIVEKSPYRVESECKYYKKCGGCNMMHIESEYQKILRRQILIDIFAQNGIELTQNDSSPKNDFPLIIDGPANNYRARFQLNEGGLSSKGSNVIIPVENCLCAEKSINDYLAKTDYTSRPKGRTHLFGSEFMDDEDVKISSTPKQSDLQKGNSKYKIYGKKNKLKIKENHYFAGTVDSPENTVIVKIANKNISFDVRGFFQSNLFVFEKVIALILENLPGGNQILDMYAGCGSISTFLTQKYENVVLVEHNRDALVFAEKNLSGTKHISYGLSGENWVKTCATSCGKFDAIVIDPPRSGMENEVCQWLCKSETPLIISLSCDPTTQARDCAKLLKAGYKISKSYLLDFYPNTSHIESLMVLEK